MNNASILVVDPDPAHRNYLNMVLTAQGYDVFSANNASRAKLLLSDINPDLILLDDSVNELTPVNLTDEVEANNMDCFVIVMSNSGDLDRSMSWIMAGALACLKKPIQFDKLNQAINAGMDNKQAFHEILTLNRDLKNTNDELKRNQDLLVGEREALREKTEELRFLNRLGTELNAAQDREKMANLVIQGLSKIISNELAILVTIFEPQRELNIFSSRDLLPDLHQAFVKRYVTEYAPDTDAKNIGYCKIGPAWPMEKLSSPPPHSINVPLIMGGKNCGSITLYFTKKPEISPDKKMLINSAATQAVQALYKAHQHQIALHQARTDPLTGLFNRRTFENHLRREYKRSIRSKQSISLIMIDLDHFKSVNDRFGHQAGDEVLRTVANAISESTRETDITARYGGEEFVVILPDTDIDQAHLLAVRIMEQVNEMALPLGGIIHRQTISQGICDSSAPLVKHPSDLVLLADQALYKAKAEGRNRIIRAQASNFQLEEKEKNYA